MSCKIDDKKYLVKTAVGIYTERGNSGLSTDEYICEIPSGTTVITCENGCYYFWNTDTGESFVDGEWVQTGGLSDIRHLEDYVQDSRVEIIWERKDAIEDNELVKSEDSLRKPVKSDGGSSSYYKREIPKLMMERWKKEGVIEAKDVMKLFLGNDYNFCNSFKAHCRVQSLREGVGKEGASEKYDLRKAWFFSEDAYNDYLERGEK